MATEGGPTGIAVETINEAARRSGISLQWVQTGTSSEQSFRRGLVDLWPLMGDLPDRRKWIHITAPWLHTNHTLVLRQHGTTPDRGFTGRLGIFKLPVHSRLARDQFPEAQLVQFADTHDVIRAVCTGSVGAAFMELRAALATLTEKPPECISTALRVAPVPDSTLQLGVASTFQAAGAADKLRNEIGKLFRDGTLAATMAKYSYYGLESEWATYDLMETAERSRWIAWTVGIVGVAMVVTLWQAASLRQRKLSEAPLRVS